ncbi:winged helix-turn-helix transcriptional regulator [Enterococcus sp. UD-01]|uniref:winged helix-turn-helix transcriptional regulator n=1 Tax=Enterococcus sp. UD-01 TaxID=3373911 RepID=UPI00384C8621
MGDNKVIQRKIYPEIPTKVEYSLTEVGQKLSPVLQALCEWGTKYSQTINLSE